MRDGYIDGMENAMDIVSDYQALRKKLDSRRSVRTMDPPLTEDAHVRAVQTRARCSNTENEL